MEDRTERKRQRHNHHCSETGKKIRVEVGRGLEGVLTDLAAGRIVDLVIKPKFKRGDFDGGFVAGVHSLIDATRGEFKADKNHLPKKKDNIHSFLTILIFGVIVLLFIGSISRIVGGVSGAIGIPALIHLTLTPIGLIAFIILSAAGLLAGLFLQNFSPQADITAPEVSGQAEDTMGLAVVLAEDSAVVETLVVSAAEAAVLAEEEHQETGNGK